MEVKVPIEILPVELRIKIYELGDVSSISTDHEFPWASTILMSGILNDKDAVEIAAIQGDEPKRIMCSYIALSGNLPMIKWARSDKSSKKDDAAEERLMKHNCFTPFPWDEDTCCNTAVFGHFKLLKWLNEQGCPWNHRTFAFAAYFGNLEMLEWLFQNKCPWDKWTFVSAAESGHFDVLKWLHERKCPSDISFRTSTTTYTFCAAVCSGNLDMVEWLIGQPCRWSSCLLMDVAAQKGNLTMIQWLVDRAKARSTHFDIIKWLDEQRGRYAFVSAAEKGHFEILKWFHEQGCPWDRNTFSFAKKTEISKSSSGFMNKDAHGTQRLVLLQQEVETSRSSSGSMNMVAHGMRILVLELQKVGISRSSSGYKSRGVHGMEMLVLRLQLKDILLSSYGFDNRDVHGTGKLCILQNALGTTIYIHGLLSTDAKDSKTAEMCLGLEYVCMKMRRDSVIIVTEGFPCCAKPAYATIFIT